MAFEIFSKDEIQVAGKVVKWGIIILIVTAIISSLLRIGLVYMSDGEIGLKNFIKGNTDASSAMSTEENLKQTLEVEKATTVQPATLSELPIYLEVPSQGIKTKIEAPETTSVSVLDAALQRAAVYYQGSGTPGQRNMLIFGHSTGFKIVNNQAYKVFNNIKLAKPGEKVYVQTDSGTYTYVVRQVKKVSKYNTWIQFDSEKPILTLATCDSFGKASDRWVLVADYVGFSGR